MALILVLGSMTAAFAREPAGGSSASGSGSGTETGENTKTKAPAGKFEVTGYTIAGNAATIVKDQTVNITLSMKYTDPASTFDIDKIDVARLVDSFRNDSKASVSAVDGTSSSDGGYTFKIERRTVKI